MPPGPIRPAGGAAAPPSRRTGPLRGSPGRHHPRTLGKTPPEVAPLPAPPSSGGVLSTRRGLRAAAAPDGLRGGKGEQEGREAASLLPEGAALCRGCPRRASPPPHPAASPPAPARVSASLKAPGAESWEMRPPQLPFKNELRVFTFKKKADKKIGIQYARGHTQSHSNVYTYTYTNACTSINHKAGDLDS